jgi:signal transduction histidine kinase
MLQRQVTRHVPPDLVPALTSFLNEVNGSYMHYDKDRKMLAHAMDLSSRELEESNSLLREHNAFLEQLNCSAAHDLKNHALNIHGMVTLLTKYQDADPVKREEVLAYLLRATAQFTRTVRDFLDVAKLESKTMEMSAVNRIDGLPDVVELECDHLIKRKGAIVRWTFNGSEALMSPPCMKLVLVNLLSNAIKYSNPDRKPEIGIRIDRAMGPLRVVVEDNGLGIDVERNGPKLFTMFSRFHADTQEEGSGIGLYTVRKVLEREKGTIALWSELGKGTRFTIEIPIAA